MKQSFGIDFGTTNSACIGIVEGRRVTKYTDGEDEPFPSLVVIDRVTNEVTCGREAWSQRQELGESCEIFPSIKSFLGTHEKWSIGGHTWTPEMIAAQVFLGLKSQVAERDGSELSQAVVAVPVGFSPEKKKSLRNAAKIAGIEIDSFVSESTAAVFHSYESIKDFSKIGVFDWGGGTLDISIVENEGGTIREIAVGNEYLGGDDIDLKLAKYAHHKLERKYNKGFAFEDMPARAKDFMIVKCEVAKREFSYTDVVNIAVNRYGDYGSINVSVNYSEFQRLIQPEISRAVDCMEQTLRQARMNLQNLGCVLFVGGSVNLRPFIDEIETSWDCHKIYPADSDWSVSHGAALLEDSGGEYILGETIGVLLPNDEIYPIAEEGRSLSRISTTSSFAIVEDSDTANFIFVNPYGTVLGYFHVPTFGFFNEQIDLEFTVDADLVARVHAKSQKRSERFGVEWVYTSPKFLFKLPVKSSQV